MDALSFRQQEQLFHELAQFSRSGLTLGHAFEVLSRNSKGKIGARLSALKTNLEASGDVGLTFRDAGFSESDAAIIQAGEAAGRLDAVFLELGDYYRQLAEARGTIITKSIYPLLVLHAGAVLLAIPPAMINDGCPTFLAQSLPILAGFYAILMLGALFWGSRTFSYELDSVEIHFCSFPLCRCRWKPLACFGGGRCIMRKCLVKIVDHTRHLTGPKRGELGRSV